MTVALWIVTIFAAAAFVAIGLAKFERRLDRGRFVRIHRSAIVNVDKVKELRPALHGEFEVILAGGRRLRCSRTYAAELTRVMES